ncbi:60S ribosomal protein L23 [Dendrothele bispora CBS 962.96]|uniref:60S ribosomal protein L23 n=1 Tax=Dendrothele bispora (strain CBS 962.96) TaxID=1314807 RepID=A0A4S8LNU4_DENBC|nr:60S ribosomal protein L23 [Dendrothele bispora CBS 962.96]
MSQAVGNTALAYARAWHQVDATDRILGKLAEKIALVLMGKHKPIYNPAVDSGDYVIITNCKKIRVSGRKDEQLVYRKHSMYPGGLKETPYQDMMRKKPEEIIRHAVSGMLPKNKLRDRRLERLRIFPGDETGVLGANVLRSWSDGTLPKDWNPQQLVRDSQRILPAGMVDKSVKFTRKA